MCNARWLLLAVLPIGAFAQDYADPKLCAACHPAIAATYRENGMGRSFSAVRPEILIEDFTRDNSYYHAASGTAYQMLRRGDRIFQRRYQTGPDGREVNVDEKSVDYIVGSGNHMRTYLHRNSDNTLLQLPLAWYAEKGRYWAMNPGFDSPDYPYATRRIGYDCMFCHNAYPRTPAGHERLGDLPVYSSDMPQGIDCQRCHGPGAGHVKAATTPGAKPETIRAAIVNPARLNPSLQIDVCAQCHLKTTEFRLPHAIKRYDRGDFSFRPGEPLADFALVFGEAPAPGRSERFETASAVTRLRESQCFLQSKGPLTCITCHNPHDIRHGAEGATLYSKTCLQCHAKALSQQIVASRHTRQTRCIDCHMPKRRTDDIVHMAVTDHLIQRFKPPGDLLAERPEYHEDGSTMYHGEVVPYESGARPANPASAADAELYVALAQVRDGANLEKGIPRLERAIAALRPSRPEPYFELANAYRDIRQGGYALALYREALRLDPKYVPALLEYSSTLKLAGDLAGAMAAAKRATETEPTDPRAWNALGQLALDAGQLQAAVASLKQALALDRELAAAHNGIGVALAERGDAEKAAAEFQEAIRILPNYGEAHGNAANLLSWKKDYLSASREFEAAIRFQPADVAARLNYALMLNETRSFDAAEAQAGAVIRWNPKVAEAHDLLGTLLERKGAVDSALAEYREAVRLKPDFERAQLNLGAVLLDRGDNAGAREHLSIAAKSSDPKLRQIAENLLRRVQ
jgi:tetratricopeptide (TPR) repeat protein